MHIDRFNYKKNQLTNRLKIESSTECNLVYTNDALIIPLIRDLFINKSVTTLSHYIHWTLYHPTVRKSTALTHLYLTAKTGLNHY